MATFEAKEGRRCPAMVVQVHSRATATRHAGESQRWRKCATQVHCREQRPLALRYDDSQRNKYNYAASNFRKYWIPVIW
jgi:hypothetical protein